ncbi:unnamed protein product [Candidula unifasciata]|uniref:E3 ubiquitin-protein ligase RBBP6 n=1 Tax=Candidula unifasciata TaxID=100452 RepID=A0A8S3ZVE3_9EUPU|nr:unnamed protein product [Candidula unifasciata]
MSCIHYKFKSSLDYNSVTFDGMHMSLGDLKKAISLQKRLKPGEFDLEITNAQTGDVYKKNDELIAKNTSVIVSRVPVNKTTASSTQKSWEAFKQECAKVPQKNTVEKLLLHHVPHTQQTSEIDKIKAVINQSTIGFEPSNFVGKYQQTIPYDHYVCKRCNQRGHFVTNCPNSNPEDRYNEPRIKRTTGIPSTMLTIVDDPMHPGALLTHGGQFAVPTVDVQGYREVKKERPPFLPFEKNKEPEKKKIPQELLCHICEDLCVDAAIAPCCGTSFCDECLREVLLESDDHMCPSCKETNVSPDKIVPNRSTRLAVTNFLNDTGYTKVKKRRLSSHNGDSSPQTPPASNQPTSPMKPSFQPGSSSGSHGITSSAFTDRDILNQPHVPVSNTSAHSFPPNTTQEQTGQFQPQYNYSRPPRLDHNRYNRNWRHHSGSQPSAISTISRRNDDDMHYNRSYGDKSSHNAGGYSASSTNFNRERSSGMPATSGAAPVLNAAGQAESLSSVAQAVWPIMTSSLLKSMAVPFSNSIPPLTTVLNVRPPPLGIQTPAQAFLSGFPHAFQGHRPPLPSMPAAIQTVPVPMSREEFYEAKKKKPVDVFESFADLTKRRSRTPERRRSYSRSRSGSWSKRSNRASSLSPGKRRSRSVTARRFTSRSRSISRQRSQNRSRSKSPLRSQNRSRSRSGPRAANRSRSRSGPRAVNRSRSRSGPRAVKRSRSRSGPRADKRSRSRSGPRPVNRSRSRSGPRADKRSRSRSGPRADKRSRSRSGPRAVKRSRSRSGPRPVNRSRSRSGPRPVNRSRSRSGPRATNRSRSRSGPRVTKRSRSRSRPKRSRSRSGPRPVNRSRSRSGARSTVKSRSRSFESSRLPRLPPQTQSLTRISKSRSRSAPRNIKALSPKPRPSLSPLRRSPKLPLPPLRSRSRSFGRSPRSRSKSWSKRARSRSYSRPRSPRSLYKSPRRSPRWSPYRSPPRKRSFSPRRRSRSLSPRKKSFRSRTRSPFYKGRFSKSRSRSITRKRSFSPKLSPRRSKSPYRMPLSPAPLKRQSPPPFRGRGGYRGRGRGGFGFRDNKFRNNRSPPRIPIATGPNIPFSADNLPPVPYFPQMGLPPPEEYFKYNPDGYQEFVRGFYAQFGPQAQAWAQSQSFPLPTADRFLPNSSVPNAAVSSHPRPAWEPVPMSPSQRPRSLTPPGGGQPRDRRDQVVNKDRDVHSTRHWEKDREREKPDQERERVRDRRFERGRGNDRYRNRNADRDRGRDEDRYRGRDSQRERDFQRETEHSRNNERSSERRRSPPRKSKEEDKSKDKGRKKSEKNKEEKEVKKVRKVEVRPKKENADVKDSILSKTSPVSDKDLESPKTEEKPSQDSLQTQKEQAEIPQNNNNVVNKSEAESKPAPEANVKVSKPAAKEKKTVKKKGDGVGGKKKIKEASTEEGGEKKVKKTKKKKLTFGASDVDTKQGLKKKKLKRLVDYKSENCTSEDGEEKASLGGSPLKKVKLADVSEVKEEAEEAVNQEKGDDSHISISEPTCEVSTEIHPAQAAAGGATIEHEIKAAAPEPTVKATEESVPDKLIPELPELSKWEREDFDYFDSVEHVKEKPQEKVMLPRSVVDKAEKFLTHKPMRNAVIATHVTTSSRSPETAAEKQAAEHRPSSPQSKSSRRVFIDHRRDSRDKKQDLHITVKTDKRKEFTDKRGPTASKGEDHPRYHHHHERDDYGEDQRSVVKSCSLERELHDSKTLSRVSKDKEGNSRRERPSHDSSQKQDSSRRDNKYETLKDRRRDKSPDPRERKHDRENSAASHPDTSKSSKDLRHKLDEKSKTKSAVDHRKLSVMDESEFVPDYEDLAPEGNNDNERDDATASQNSEASSPEQKDKKKNRDNEDNEKEGESKPDSDDPGKKKSKKKHKHKEKKEKHKHKKKKHKHKKDKEGKQKTKPGENSP